MNQPYICVTGFDHPKQIDQLGSFEANNHRIVCGVLVSHRTLLGESKSRYPCEEDVVKIARNVRAFEYVLAIHYCPKGNPANVAADDVEEICGLAKPSIIQLNCGNPVVIEAMLKALPKDRTPEVVFQMNRTILGRHGDKHSSVIEYFKKIGGNHSYNHCLYDMSGGKGIGIPKEGFAWDDKVRHHNDLCGMIGKHGLIPGVAGGLNPRNVADAIGTFGKSISIDCESGVRDADDKLVMDEVNSFYGNACKKIYED